MAYLVRWYVLLVHRCRQSGGGPEIAPLFFRVTFTTLTLATFTTHPSHLFRSILYPDVCAPPQTSALRTHAGRGTTKTRAGRIWIMAPGRARCKKRAGAFLPMWLIGPSARSYIDMGSTTSLGSAIVAQALSLHSGRTGPLLLPPPLRGFP